ncbi:MAG: alpha/beta hydrolase family protein [Stellaceae bacterium]
MARVDPLEQPGIRGFLHQPEGADEGGLVLTHGAGGDCRSPLLVAVADAFCHRGIAVLRCDLPFRQRRAKGPPSPAHAPADREGLRLAVAALRAIVSGPVFLGGQSYGGRQASLLAADLPELAAGLLLFSYPLHPPGKPQRLRSEHFPRLRVPVVFVQGAADPFASIAELEAALALIPAATRLIPIPGAGHDLKRGRFDLDAVAEEFLKHNGPDPSPGGAIRSRLC